MKLFWTKWKIIRTIWPYSDGWGTYRKNIITGRRILLDSGLTKDQAIQSAKQLNNAKNI